MSTPRPTTAVVRPPRGQENSGAALRFLESGTGQVQQATDWQAAIVDLDGTMIDTVGDFEVALNAMLADLGLPGVDREFITRTVGQGSAHLIRNTLARVGADLGADPGLAERAWQHYQRHYLAVNGQFSAIYPGVTEGLALLQSAGVKLACVTNKPGNFARPLLAAKGLDRYFAHIFGGDAFARQKPDPLPLIEACSALGSTPARTIAVGDSRNDAQAASAAGCPLVLVNYGYNHGQPIRELPAWQHLDRLDQLLL